MQIINVIDDYGYDAPYETEKKIEGIKISVTTATTKGKKERKKNFKRTRKLVESEGNSLFFCSFSHISEPGMSQVFDM